MTFNLSDTERVIRPTSKTAAVILRLLERADDRNSIIGRTKLMKLLYYVDFRSYKSRGKSVTGLNYTKLPYGPVPKSAFTTLESLESRGYVMRDEFRLQNGGHIVRYRFPAGTRLEHGLSSEELEIVDRTFDDFADLSTSAIVDKTHEEAPWMLTEMGNPIPMELARFLDD